MAALTIASKVNQATTFPPLLIAYYAQESDQKSSININFEDAEILKSGEKSVIEFAVDGKESIYGAEQVTSHLVDIYPFLKGKHEKPVSYSDDSGET